MAFAESIKKEVRRKADFNCCRCRATGIEVHHIVPKAYGGTDDIDNAAPLCPNCHRFFGNDPKQRKQIKEMRDVWYDKVSSMHLYLPIEKTKTVERIILPSGEVIEKEVEKIVYTNGMASVAEKLSPPVEAIDHFDQCVNHLRRGNANFHKSDFIRAAKEYQLAYSHAVKTNKNELIAITLYELGASVGMQHKHKDSIEYFDKAIRINPNYADAWSNKGAALAGLGEYEDAFECYKKAIKINPNHANAWHNKGMAFKDIGKYEEALKCYDKAVKINPNYTEALRNIGHIHRRRHKFEKALKCFQKSISAARKVKDYKGMTSDYYNRGVIFEMKGNYAQALVLYKKCEEYAKRYSFEVYEARAYLGKGRLLARKGHYKESIESMKKAVKIFEKVGDKEDIPRAYTNIGAAEFYVNIDEAIKWHEKCIDISERFETKRMLGYGLSNAAGCYIEKMELKKARKYLQKALPIFERLDEEVMISSVLIMHARISLLKGHQKHAMNYLNRAMKIVKDMEVPSETAYVLLQFGIALKDIGEFAKAKSYFEKALKIFTDVGKKEMKKEVEKELKSDHFSSDVH